MIDRYAYVCLYAKTHLFLTKINFVAIFATYSEIVRFTSPESPFCERLASPLASVNNANVMYLLTLLLNSDIIVKSLVCQPLLQ